MSDKYFERRHITGGSWGVSSPIFDCEVVMSKLEDGNSRGELVFEDDGVRVYKKYDKAYDVYLYGEARKKFLKHIGREEVPVQFLDLEFKISEEEGSSFEQSQTGVDE